MTASVMIVEVMDISLEIVEKRDPISSKTLIQILNACILPNKEVVGSDRLQDCCVSNSKVQLQCGHQLPFINAVAAKGRHVDQSMPVTVGYVGKELVQVLRDTGCSSVVVRGGLVRDVQLTGKVQHCVLIDGTVRRVEVANISVDTPYYVGRVEALCMANPVYDLVLGNIEGVRRPEKPDQNWVDRQNVDR